MRVVVTKADGTTEYFKIEKLRRSLRRAGASPEENKFNSTHYHARII
jgi:transcriptional regulator NrdR family protein